MNPETNHNKTKNRIFKGINQIFNFCEQTVISKLGWVHKVHNAISKFI